MSVNGILNFIAQILFVALSIISILTYLRQRNARRRDFALLSISLGFPLGATLLMSTLDFTSDLLDLIGAILLFFQPYFLFRLLQYYRPSRRWLHIAILFGTIANLVVLILFIATYPSITQVVVFGYCVIVDAYCTWAYSRDIFSTVGVLRRRLWYITLSAGLFTLALAGNAVKAVLPDLAQPISAVGLAITGISAILYYLAFVPPRWLRHAWQFEELRNFLIKSNLAKSSAEYPKSIKGNDNIRQLYSAATQSINGTLGAVVQWDTQSDQWVMLGSTNDALASKILENGYPLIQQVWERQQPLAIYVPEIRDVAERHRLAVVGARTWLLVPIHTPERLWGILLVVLRDRSLFTDDDLALLELFAQQCAILLENNRLIAELHDYSEQLERKVEERTSELRTSEAALRELNATLEQRVEQRTEELQRSNVELDQFAFIASHDLKAPLRAINNLATWIEQDAAEFLPATSKEHLAKLQGRVRRMETLLNDLLAYSRVGRQRHTPEVVDIGKLVHNVSEILAPPAGFTVSTCRDLPIMRVECTPLETVFRNLIGNAIKHHHHPSTGTVNICAQDQGDFVEFSVSDNGPGIAPEFHERVFEIFRTLQPRDQVEGSGIGLAVVKKSVESRGGTIRVHSALGEGTTFSFTWPKVAA